MSLNCHASCRFHTMRALANRLIRQCDPKGSKLSKRRVPLLLGGLGFVPGPLFYAVRERPLSSDIAPGRCLVCDLHSLADNAARRKSILAASCKRLATRSSVLQGLHARPK